MVKDLLSSLRCNLEDIETNADNIDSHRSEIEDYASSISSYADDINSEVYELNENISSLRQQISEVEEELQFEIVQANKVSALTACKVLIQTLLLDNYKGDHPRMLVKDFLDDLTEQFFPFEDEPEEELPDDNMTE